MKLPHPTVARLDLLVVTMRFQYRRSVTRSDVIGAIIESAKRLRVDLSAVDCAEDLALLLASRFASRAA